MTKSNDGEKSCPLCMEEMDLTDQQLKPCKCGYEICVWCWHHIVEMAEKEGNEGRCPACRAPYDKDRIAGTAAKCERLVAEANADRRTRAHKGKPRISAEARKQLADVRVIQRNLVYIIGMPPAIADVHILERKEYFGQYGKIVKISISRPNGGVQQSTNSNAVGVYITYAREEEAVRCIQAVHNFVLEGKLLRACFGTTKYCHSWIRNMTCSNPDCYYLHDICSQEDSFSKNEIISSYPRLPQVASSNSRPRAGNILPPPPDEFCVSGNVSSSKITLKSSANHFAMHPKGSPPKGSGIVRSSVLPTATTWGSRPSGSTSAWLSYSQGPRDQKQETSCTKCTSSENGMFKLGKIPSEAHQWLENGKHRTSESRKATSCNGDSVAKGLSTSVDVSLSSAWHDNVATTALRITEVSGAAKSNASSRSSEAYKGDLDGKLPLIVVDPSEDDNTTQHITSAWDDDDDDIFAHNSTADSEMDSSARCKSSISPLSGCVREQGSQISDRALENMLHKDSSLENYASTSHIPSSLWDTENASVPGNRASPSCSAFHEETRMTSSTSIVRGHDCSITLGNLDDTSLRMSLVKLDNGSAGGCRESNLAPYSDPVLSRVGISSDSNLRLQPLGGQTDHLDPTTTSMVSAFPEDTFVSGITSPLTTVLEKQALPPLDYQIKDTLEASRNSTDDHSDLFLRAAPDQISGASCLMPDDLSVNSSTYMCNNNYRSNCLSGSLITTDISSSETSDILNTRNFLLPNSSSGSKFDSVYSHGNPEEKSSHATGANSGIDGEDTIISNILSMEFDPWSDPLSANNSLIKLLRETGVQRTQPDMSGSLKPQGSNQSRFSFAREEQPTSLDKLPTKSSLLQDVFADPSHHVSTTSIFPQSVATLSGHSSIPSDRTPVVSRAKISAPPGFSAQCRAPPPGFSSQNISNQVYGQGSADVQILGGSSSGQPVHLPQHGNSGDVEFIDPAILAVVRGSSPVSSPKEFNLGSFPSTQSSAPESDSRFHFLVNQSIPPHQTQKISDHGENFLHLNGHPPTWPAGQNFSKSSPFIQRFLHSEDSYISNNLWDHCGNRQFGNDLAIAELLRKGFALNNNLPGSENFKSHTVDPSSLCGRAFGL